MFTFGTLDCRRSTPCVRCFINYTNGAFIHGWDMRSEPNTMFSYRRKCIIQLMLGLKLNTQNLSSGESKGQRVLVLGKNKFF
jgi:hypothetical protein